MNRSEELCNLLGIYKVKCTEDEQTSYTTSDEICNNCDPDYKNCWSRILIYPDLTKPSNFVQLLKIHPKGTSSFFHKCEDFIYSIYGVKSLEDDIIGTIIDKVFPSLTTRHKNLAKHQAQATKWDY